MIRSLRIENFKAWKDTQPIAFAPLTLFFGNNSSGKSSLGQFLLLLKQTVDSPDRRTVLYPGDDSTVVNAGSFQELLHGRNPKSELNFELMWDLPEQLEIKDVLSGRQYTGRQMSFSAKLGFPSEESSAPVVKEFLYELLNDHGDAQEIVMSLGMKRVVDLEGSEHFELVADQYQPIRRQQRHWPLPNPARFYGFPDEVAAYYQNMEFAQDFSLELEKLLRRISYIGPLRQRAKRLYIWEGSAPDSVGSDGGSTIRALLAAKERTFTWRKGVKGKSFGEVIAHELKALGVIQDFNVQPVARHRKEYEVKVRTPGASDWVDLVDVGFGVSQVLPVLVQCYYAPAGSIILMEQPELHLHPGAQTNLADLFIKVLAAREDGSPRSLQLIIESHSEHFLQRLQLRIAETQFASTSVAAYFAYVTGDKYRLESLAVDSRGNITNWPERFFGDLMGDAVAFSEAQAKVK